MQKDSVLRQKFQKEQLLKIPYVSRTKDRFGKWLLEEEYSSDVRIPNKETRAAMQDAVNGNTLSS